MAFAVGVLALAFLTAFSVYIFSCYRSAGHKRAARLEAALLEIDKAAETEYLVTDSPFASHVRDIIRKVT